MARKTFPRPINFSPQCAVTSKARKRPLAPSYRAHTRSRAPTPQAFRWSTSMRVPTVISPGASDGSTARDAATSIRPIMAGVESTAGRRGSKCWMVNSWGTSCSKLCSRPRASAAGSVDNAALQSLAGNRAQVAGRGRRAEEAAENLSECEPQLGPQPPLQRAVILRAAKDVAHQRAEGRASPHELDHARGHRAAQKRAGKQTPRHVHGKLKIRGEFRSEEHTSELQSPYDLVC